MSRRLSALVAALLLTAAAIGAAQTPTFRSGIDAIALDVSVVDAQGHPVEDLDAGDFLVEIDGAERPVLSAELVAVARTPASAPVAGVPSLDAFYSTNLAPPAGRRFVLAVDQSHLSPTVARPVMRAAGRLLDRLSPEDQVALITFPGTGPRLDFTDDLAAVRRALEQVVGQRSEDRIYQFPMGLSEAVTIEARERTQASTSSEAALGEQADQPVMAAVMTRGCSAGDASGRDACRRAIITEASTRVAEMRSSANRSIAELEALVDGLASVDGPKSLVLISASLAIDDHREVEQIVRRAGTGRTSIDVVMIDSQETEGPTRTETALADRRIRFEGLEELARQSRGALHRVVGTGEEIFDRLGVELSASYIVGVEVARHDLARESLRVRVSVDRPGVRIRTSPAFAAPPVPADDRSVGDALRAALESPFATPGLPVRVATFAVRDAPSGKTRVTVAGQVGQTGAQDGEYTVGVLLADDGNLVLTRTAEQVTLLQTEDDARLPYTSSVLLDPGEYSLRFGAVDAEGRVGGVVRELHVAAIEDGFAASDLIVGGQPRVGEALAPRVEPLVRTRGVAAYLELYAPDLRALGATAVVLEVANSTGAPALASERAEIRPGARSGWGVATGSVDLLALVPGRYVLRARIAHPGGAIVRERPFVFEGVGFVIASR